MTKREKDEKRDGRDKRRMRQERDEMNAGPAPTGFYDDNAKITS